MTGELTVVVLAAGGGTRMKSKTMKVLHPVAGRTMIAHVLAAVQETSPRRIVTVVGHQRDQVGAHIQELVPDVVLAVQEEQHGTGHAVRVAMDAVVVQRPARCAGPCSSRTPTPRCSGARSLRPVRRRARGGAARGEHPVRG